MPVLQECITSREQEVRYGISKKAFKIRSQFSRNSVTRKQHIHLCPKHTIVTQLFAIEVSVLGQ